MKRADIGTKPMPLVLDTEEVYYPIALDFEYYVLDRGCIVSVGTGKTARISRKAMVLESAAGFAPGAELQIICLWPVLYEGKEDVALLVRATAAGSTGAGLVLTI